MTAPPRILKVEYRSAVRRRNATFYCKVPYGQHFDLVAKLTRMLTMDQVLWFRVDVAKPGEITTEIRGQLERWLPAITHTTELTGVDLDA